MRRRSAFTLVELLTVAFILAILIALTLPGIQGYRKRILRQRTDAWLQNLRTAANDYHAAFGDYPPSEPDKVDPKMPGVSSNSNVSYYGAAALAFYLAGSDGAGYSVSSGSNLKRVWETRLAGMPMVDKTGFLDGWGSPVQYFRAYRNREGWAPGAIRTTADIYPRAVNVGLGGENEYRYVFSASNIIGGFGFRVGVTRWLNGYTTYASGWARNSVPVNATGFILISPGADGLSGTEDDVGDVGWE